jgi:hypothetical protein
MRTVTKNEKLSGCSRTSSPVSAGLHQSRVRRLFNPPKKSGRSRLNAAVYTLWSDLAKLVPHLFFRHDEGYITSRAGSEGSVAAAELCKEQRRADRFIAPWVLLLRLLPSRQ